MADCSFNVILFGTVSELTDCDCFIFPNETFIGEAEVAVVADNDMVKEADVPLP